MDEMIDVLDESGVKTGEVLPKSEVHRHGLWHRCFHCWLLQTSPEMQDDPRLLLQRRSKDKETWPGWLDVSVAGHISAGETSLEGGVRETAEEIGLTVKPSDLIPLGTRRVEFDIPAGRDREFHDVFMLLDPTPLPELRLQQEEVDAVLAVHLPDVQDLSQGLEVPAEELGFGGQRKTFVSVRDFVGEDGNYLAKIVGAAQKVLSGEDVGTVFRLSP